MYAKLNHTDYESCIIAIGSNQKLCNSSSSDVLSSAIRHIAETVGPILSLSRFFQTPAFPKGSGPDFVNAVLACDAEGTAEDILVKLHSIEHDLGRVRETRWGQRTIDIDLIAVGQNIVPNVAEFKKWQHLPFTQQTQIAPDQLILPHPRMQERAFVLGPLMDVCPSWIHPVINRSVAEMHEELDFEAKTEVVPL